AVSIADAETTAAFVVRWVQKLAGRRWLLGVRKPPLAFAGDGAGVRLLATRHLHKIADPVARAIAGWSCGERRVDRLDTIPTPREVLAFQARGRRCVSLLDDETDTHPHENPLAFALHDLCHLEKLASPADYAGQVGFFRSCERALFSPRWASI